MNQIRMAEIAGIGTIGKNGLLIHSRYGARLMLGGLLTTAKLPSMCYPEDEQLNKNDPMGKLPSGCHF